MPIIHQNKWYNSNKLAIARFQETKLYEPELNTRSDEYITAMLDIDSKQTNRQIAKQPITNENGDIVILSDSKYASNSNTIQEMNKYDTNIWFSLPTKSEQNAYKHRYKHRYNSILKKIAAYKLRKTKDGEDEPLDSPELMVSTIRMSKIDADNVHNMTLMYLIMLKEGKLWLEFNNHVQAQVFYRQKDRLKSLVAENSRCLADCDNLLKIICRHIKYSVIDEVFVQNHINNNINRARKCFVKYYDDNKGIVIRKLCFESVAQIGCVLHKTEHPFMLLDLTNAYNNVLFPFLQTVLKEYLPNPKNVHPNIRHGNLNGFYDIRDKNELDNIISSISKLLKTIRYHDKHLGIEIRRNKGVPQGSALSIDIFIMCMDYILKECIVKLHKKLQLRYNKDYKFIAYVDDILILLKSESAYKACNDILDVMSSVFNSRHFKLNSKKSKCSPILAKEYGCNVPTVKPSDKYLGIYLERNLDKYLALVEREIAARYHNNPHMQSFDMMEANIPIMKTHEKARIRGKLQFVLAPFAKDKVDRSVIMKQKGYPLIASLFQDDAIDLSVISPKLDTDQYHGPNVPNIKDILNDTKESHMTSSTAKS